MVKNTVRMVVVAVAMATALNVLLARAGALDELWVHSYRSYFASEKQFRAMMDLVPRAKAAGYTGVCFMSGRDTDGNWGQLVSDHNRTEAFVKSHIGLDAWWRVDPERQRRFKEFKAQCDRHGIDFAPFVWSVGYGGAASLDDPKLTSVWPVRDIPYVVRGGRAVYAGGEEVTGDLEGLERRNAGKAIFDGAVRLEVLPARRYRVRFEAMSENLDRASGALPNGIMISVRTANEMLLVGSKRPHLGANRKWTPLEFTFNSFDETNVVFRVACGAHGGGRRTSKFDEAKAVAAGARFGVRNIRIEALGLEQPIRRVGAPFVVRDAASGRTLKEGVGYEPPPVPRYTTFSGPYEPVDFAVSWKLPEGTRLLVSAYEPAYYWGMQNGLCLTTPELDAWFEQSAAALVREFNLKKWLFSNDEIRNECRCELCVATHQNIGQRFAAAVTRARDIVRRHAPDADIYMFADQVDPNHNAEEHCYGCHTSFVGVWDLMPKDIIMCPWYGSKCDVCVKFLSDHGYRTFGFGYYDKTTDEKTVESARNWVKALVGNKGGRGLCYTSWLKGDVGGDFDRIELFAKAAHEAAAEAAVPSDK